MTYEPAGTAGFDWFCRRGHGGSIRVESAGPHHGTDGRYGPVGIFPAVAGFWLGVLFLLVLAVTLHNIPEGMAVAVPLISGGMPKWRSAAITALTGFPTILGALLGFTVGAMGATALALSLSFASGAMLYVVFGELLPESILMWRSKLPATATIIGMLTGLVIIYL